MFQCFLGFFMSSFTTKLHPPVDKHLAYGIWFAATWAGYACSKCIGWLPGTTRAARSAMLRNGVGLPGRGKRQAAWAAIPLMAQCSMHLSLFL